MTQPSIEERVQQLETQHQLFLERHAQTMSDVEVVIDQVDAKIRATWDSIRKISDTVEVLGSYINVAVEGLQRHAADGHGGE